MPNAKRRRGNREHQSMFVKKIYFEQMTYIGTNRATPNNITEKVF